MNIAVRFYRFIRYDMCLFSEYDSVLYKKYARKEMKDVNQLTIVFALIMIMSTPKLISQLDWYQYGAKLQYIAAQIRNFDMFQNDRKLFDNVHKIDYKGSELFYTAAGWVFWVILYGFMINLRSRRANVKVSEGLAEERSMNAPLYVHNGHIIVDNHGYIVSPVAVGDNANLLVSSGDINSSSLQESLNSISKFVSSSGNAEAKQLWDSFNEEIDGKRRKSVLKSTWNGLVNILPDVAKLAEAAAEIGKIFI